MQRMGKLRGGVPSSKSRHKSGCGRQCCLCHPDGRKASKKVKGMHKHLAIILEE